LADTSIAKVRSIREVVDLVAAEIGLPAGFVIPVGLDPGRAKFNVEGLWSRVEQLLPEAQQANLLRRLRGASSSWSLGKIWSQTKGIVRSARSKSSR
jgi:hypothetical protein